MVSYKRPHPANCGRCSRLIREEKQKQMAPQGPDDSVAGRNVETQSGG